ncbi:MAG: hypothetical protein MJE66_00665 [Proteobacteria bacterium]|nr:hypothetical protein [Pseudomonadota bacterium]
MEPSISHTPLARSAALLVLAALFWVSAPHAHVQVSPGGELQLTPPCCGHLHAEPEHDGDCVPCRARSQFRHGIVLADAPQPPTPTEAVGFVTVFETSLRRLLLTSGEAPRAPPTSLHTEASLA